MALHFSWKTFDVTSQLPASWRKDISATIADADIREFPRTPILSREAADVPNVPRGRVHAGQVRQNLPWLYDFYQGLFLELAGTTCDEPVLPANDDRYGVVLNVQRGTRMRFECHVDSNPMTGILFCTDHPAGAGGELVVANDKTATGITAIDRDCSVIRPHAGQLIFFDGSEHPHYARPLSSGSDMRVVAVMNFYTKSRPESTRPPELNRHLFGQDTGPPAKIPTPEPVSSYIRRLGRQVPTGVDLTCPNAVSGRQPSSGRPRPSPPRSIHPAATRSNVTEVRRYGMIEMRNDGRAPSASATEPSTALRGGVMAKRHSRPSTQYRYEHYDPKV